MPNALRTATPMGDWRSFKTECDVSAGWEGIKTAEAADAAGARHSYLYQIQDVVAAILDDADFGEEAVAIYHAEKILVPKTVGRGEVFAIGDRVYFIPATRLVTRTYDSTYLWIGMATEPAGGDDLRVEIDLKGDHAEMEA